MGKGRPNLPLNMRIVADAGQPVKDIDKVPDPPVIATIPPAPDQLSKAAAKHWPTFAEQLSNMRVLTAADYPALCMLCEAYAQYWKCLAGVKKQGIVYETAGGAFRISPHVAAANTAHTQVLRILVEFGMTPSSRMKVRSG